MKFDPFRSAVVLVAMQVAVSPVAAEAVLRDTRQAASSPVGNWSGTTHCEPYARRLSGIAIKGEAHNWWNQAEGRYARASRPRIGAVLSFAPHAKLSLGHLATVTRVVDKRTILVSHANWAPTSARTGQIDRDVPVVDVSPGNTWSEVRVWYAPSGALGTEAWPVLGFILPARVSPPVKHAGVERSPLAKITARAGIGPDFLKGIPSATEPASLSRIQAAKSDPIGRIIAARM